MPALWLSSFLPGKACCKTEGRSEIASTISHRPVHPFSTILHSTFLRRPTATHSIFCSPSRYTQGPNATQTLGTEIATLGLSGPILIVTSSSPRRLLESTWRQSLTESHYAFAIHDFGGECTAAEVARIVTSARAAKSATILGAGGGKVLDAARAAAADLDLPCITCPAIASTDAPCSAISVIYTEEGTVEKIRFHAKNPALVLADSQVIAQAPIRTLIAGMGDALSTVFEARACVTSHRANTRGGSCTLATRATIPGESIHHEPFPVTSKQVEAAILAADTAGRTFHATSR